MHPGEKFFLPLAMIKSSEVDSPVTLLCFLPDSLIVLDGLLMPELYTLIIFQMRKRIVHSNGRTDVPLSIFQNEELRLAFPEAQLGFYMIVSIVIVTQ